LQLQKKVQSRMLQCCGQQERRRGQRYRTSFYFSVLFCIVERKEIMTKVDGWSSRTEKGRKSDADSKYVVHVGFVYI
jgi:hypothetical protein